jgi:uncharacterized protein
VSEEADLRRVARILGERPDVMNLLASVERLRLPDGWVGAGVIRNAVWDAVSGGTVPQAPADVDVVYFDAGDATRERDLAFEAMLAAAHPGPRWSVKNQARMHERAGEGRYAGTADAIGRWPETCTSVAARLAHGRIEVLAPWGVADLLGLVVRPTPAFERRSDVFEARVREKAWTERWAGITIIRPSVAAGS